MAQIDGDPIEILLNSMFYLLKEVTIACKVCSKWALLRWHR